jgi:hypothetical protein
MLTRTRRAAFNVLAVAVLAAFVLLLAVLAWQGLPC